MVYGGETVYSESYDSTACTHGITMYTIPTILKRGTSKTGNRVLREISQQPRLKMVQTVYMVQVFMM